MRAAAMVFIAVVVGIAGGIWETDAMHKLEKMKANRWGFQTPNGEHYGRSGNDLPLIGHYSAFLAMYADGHVS
jgi:hypothetical protein